MAPLRLSSRRRFPPAPSTYPIRCVRGGNGFRQAASPVPSRAMGERARGAVIAVSMALAIALAVAAPAGAHLGTAPRAPIAGATALFDGRAKAMAAQASVAEPPIVATPRANCEPGGIPEGPMQGRVSADDV